MRYMGTIGYCVLATLLGTWLHGTLAEANLVLIYLLAVVLVTVQYGRGPGILASFLAVLAFDLFMVLPYHSLLVADPQYLLTFAMMLAVSLLVSHLMADQRHQAVLAVEREGRARALFHLSQDLSGALTREQVNDVAKQHLERAFHATVLLLVADRDGKLELSSIGRLVGKGNTAAGLAAQAVYDRSCNAPGGEVMTVAGGLQYLPLRAPMRTRGVLVLQSACSGAPATPEQERQLFTFAAQIALAIERVHYVEVARETEVAMTSERLRNSLLSAVSHDIRTPLTAIVGLSSTLATSPALAATGLRELALAIQSDAQRMNSLVNNLLDMARLDGGATRLNMEWQVVEEVVGSALASVGVAIDAFEVDISIAANLPLVRFDAVLIERVLGNLLDNAVKYAAGGGRLCVDAERQGSEVLISVTDEGPGVPAGMELEIFSKFVRGEPESSRSGVGLGLAICRAIVESHGGRIWVANGAQVGARFVFSLPVGTPPDDEEPWGALGSGAVP